MSRFSTCCFNSSLNSPFILSILPLIQLSICTIFSCPSLTLWFRTTISFSRFYFYTQDLISFYLNLSMFTQCYCDLSLLDIQVRSKRLFQTLHCFSLASHLESYYLNQEVMLSWLSTLELNTRIYSYCCFILVLAFEFKLSRFLMSLLAWFNSSYSSQLSALFPLLPLLSLYQCFKYILLFLEHSNISFSTIDASVSISLFTRLNNSWNLKLMSQVSSDILEGQLVVSGMKWIATPISFIPINCSLCLSSKHLILSSSTSSEVPNTITFSLSLYFSIQIQTVQLSNYHPMIRIPTRPTQIHLQQRMNDIVMKVIGNYTYNTRDCLGEGVYGKVFVGFDRDTKEKVAIKKIDITSYSHDHYLQNSIFYEIFLLKNLKHPNIVKFKDVLTTKNSLYIVTEYCKHGDLKEALKRKKFREDEAFEVIRQIICGFSELVREHIIHRDLKPANILINDGIYKIGDFGFAKYVENMYNHLLKTCVGSPLYMAPQLLEHTYYTTKADIWSLGIISYEILFNTQPWRARSEAQLLNNIRTIPLSSIIQNESVKISPMASDFLMRLLAYNEKDRISWEELFAFFKIEKPITNGVKVEQRKSLQNQVINSVNIVSNTSKTNVESYRMSLRNQKQHYPNQNYKRHSNPSYRSPSPPPLPPPLPPSQPQNYQHKVSSIPHKQLFLTIDQLKTLREQCIYKHFVGVQFQANYHTVESILGDTKKFDKMLLLLAGSNKLKSTYAVSILQNIKKRSIDKGVEDVSRLIEKQKELYQGFQKQTTKLLQKKGTLRLLKEEIVPKLTSVQGGQTRILKAEELLLQSSIQVSKIVFLLLKQNFQHYSQTFTLVRILDYILDIISLSIQKGFDYNISELLVVPTRNEDFDSYEYFGNVAQRMEQMRLFNQ